MTRSFSNTLFTLLAGLGLLLCNSGCRKKIKQPRPLFKAEKLDPVGLNGAQRRRLFLQVIDDQKAIAESAILEGQSYKYLLKLCSHFSQDKLYNKRDETSSYDRLKEHPEAYRGHVVAVEQSVIIEIQKTSALPAQYKLPGYIVLQALLVNSNRELFELRILTRKDSGVYEKLQKGIDDRKNPVIRVTGFFMKNHAKRDSTGQIWQEPLLVAPEPKFGKGIKSTHDAGEDLIEGGMDKRLPSTSIRTPKAEERLLVEIVAGSENGTEVARLKIGERVGALDDGAFVAWGIKELKKRLPAAHAENPSAVLVLTKDARRPHISKLLKLIRDTGLRRVYFKDEQLQGPIFNLNAHGE